MALADIPTGGQRQRLDSWKEIAEYLGRDVRTATRWEAQGLPLHRVPGGKGSSVFAFTEEIDAWMASRRGTPAALATHPPPAPPPRLDRRAVAVACAVLALALMGAALVRQRTAHADEATLHVAITPSALSITTADGTARASHPFAPERAVAVQASPPVIVDVDADGTADVLVGVSYFEAPGKQTVRGGELIRLTTHGEVRWRFAFDDVLTFGEGRFAGPWALMDWRAGPAGPGARLAVAAHDYVWWASMVAVLDTNGRRLGAFVNPGWIESVLWVDADGLAIAGFNNPRNEAMVALIDARAPDGQAPGSAGSVFACASCSAAPPRYYATLPRSEMNLLGGGRFNRAVLTLVGERIIVTTTEVAGAATSATAVYEFDRELRLLRARYSETYWDAHRRLELEGRLTHSRAACPEGEGPAAIHVWSAPGWQRIPAPH